MLVLFYSERTWHTMQKIIYCRCQICYVFFYAFCLPYCHVFLSIHIVISYIFFSSALFINWQDLFFPHFMLFFITRWAQRNGTNAWTFMVIQLCFKYCRFTELYSNSFIMYSFPWTFAGMHSRRCNARRKWISFLTIE